MSSPEHDATAQMLGERIKIFVVVQQGITALDASSRNYSIDGLRTVTPRLRSAWKFLAAGTAISLPPSALRRLTRSAFSWLG